MKILINETNKMESLTIIGINGIEWTNDLLGNAGAIEYNTDMECYTMGKEDFDWWKEYIINYESDELEIKELAKELGIDVSEIMEKISEYNTNDMGDEHIIKQNILEDIRDGEIIFN